MYDTLRKFGFIGTALGALLIGALLAPIPNVIAQGFNLQNNTSVLGHLLVAAGPTGQPPVGVGCTIVAGSTDQAGACLTTATSGSITFAQPFAVAPFCTVTDRTATPVAVYSVSTTAITLTTVTSAHNLIWNCWGPAR